MSDPADKTDTAALIAQDVVYLSVGTILSQVILIVATLLLARVYSPESFGLLGVVAAVVMVMATLLPLKYESAIMLDKSDSDAEATAQLALWSAFILSIAFIPIFSIIHAEYLSALLPNSVIELSVFIVLGSLGLAVSTVVIAWMNRFKQYKQIALAKVIQSLVFVFCALVFVQMDPESGLVYSQISAYVLVSLALFAYFARRHRLVSRERLVSSAAKHKAAPQFVLPTSLLDVLTQQLPMLLIPIWFSTEIAGQFGMAWRVVILPLSLVGIAIGQVFYQRFAVLINTPSKAFRFLFRTWVSLFALALLPAIVLAIFGMDIFVYILGDSWAVAGKISQVFSLLLLVMFVSSPTSSTFLVLGLQKFSLFFGVAQLVYRPMALFLGFIFESFTLGMALFVIFEVIQIIAYQSLAYRTVKKMIGLSTHSQSGVLR